VEDEYYTSPDGETSSRTADQVCLTCGACFYAGNTVEEDRARQRARLEGHDSGGDEGDRR
jgi:hypothetical protein